VLGVGKLTAQFLVKKLIGITRNGSGKEQEKIYDQKPDTV
jgi:hypothetical protein